MSTTEKSNRDRPSWLDLERVISLSEVEEITSLSIDSLTRHHKTKSGRSPRVALG